MAVALAASSACGADGSLSFDGVNDYVTFGAATDTLGASSFTLECWFKRTGAGATTTTGSGGLTAVPLLTKGRGEADGSNVDCNYFLGITSGGTLGADFEEYPVSGGTPGLNHPVTGRTVITNGAWYHAAVTYDNRRWSLYLNGNLETTLVVNASADRPPRYDSLQHAALGSALTSAGAGAGYFAGLLDEARVWNVVRSPADIRDGMYASLSSAPGLRGRWSLDETTGATASNSVPGAPHGALINGPVRTNDARPLVAINAVWKFLDNGSDQGTAWQAAGYDDSAWASGPAELGYGDGGEATVVSYGPDSNNKYVTTYFRRAFHVADAAAFGGLNLRAIRDDGIVAYLNGAEVWRNNMPEGAIAYNTYAASPEVSGAAETAWIGTNASAAALVAGANVVAVEIHQQRAASSDISFNFELSGVPVAGNAAPAVALTAPTTGSAMPAGTPATLAATATDDGVVTNVAFFVNGVKLGDDANSPYTFDWTPSVPGRVTLSAVATDNLGVSGSSPAVAVVVFEAGAGALQFDGVNDHVTFGQAISLGASNFTLECWLRKLGPGVTSSSGSGGITAVPLVTKGRGESENSNVDCNYFFGLLPSGALAADFEQFYAEGGAAAGQNYPVTGNSTAAGDGAWHHVAITYDGSNWVIYLDGAVDRTLNVGTHTPRFDSVQHAGLGVAMNSSGVTEGAFEGVLDEVRIWNYARGAAQIAANVSNAIATANGLIGRWSLGDGSGTAAAGTVSGAPAGTLVNGPIWCLGRSLASAGMTPPVVMLTAPAAGAVFDAGVAVTLAAAANDDDGNVASVEFFANGASVGAAAGAPWNVSWNVSPAGAFALTAVATDNDGLSATSAPVNVTAIVPNLPPMVALVAPADGAADVPADAELSVQTTDPEGLPLSVTFHGRPQGASAAPGADFTIVALPDTQYYSQSYPHIFSNQTAWIAANRQPLNIVYVTHLGDITENGDSQPYQWANAAGAMYLLEDPVATGLPDGVPYGLAPGNHDHTGVTIAGYEQYFGASHFSGKPWYGGHMGTDNQNHYALISAGGLDFLFVHTDWNHGNLTYPPIDAWANGIVQAHPGRRAVLVRHAILESNGTWNGNDGQNFFNTMKTNANVFLLLNGHSAGETTYTETVSGRRVDVHCVDYQNRANGGDGWLRLYQFSPSNNVIRVKTYSTYLGTYETDANSQFDIPYSMSGAPAPFQLLGVSNGVPSGAVAAVPWPGREPGAAYEWYATVSDGMRTTTGATHAFTTAVPPEPVVLVSNPYSNVNWTTVSAHKGNLHTHTTNSDGSQTPTQRIDEYDALDYGILALTDHDCVTWPWTAYGRDPAGLGMVGIQGNELSQGHHIVSLFSGYAGSSADETTLLTGVGAAGGLAIFAHPGRYAQPAQWYANHYLAQPHCVGQEIYNQGDRYPNDRVKWDEVLSILMPDRPVWGFSNDDAHTTSHVGRNRTHFLLESLSTANARLALERGQFYATYCTSAASVPPALTNVTVDEMAGTITVGGTGCTEVRWISRGAQVATGETLDLVATPNVAKYVRAELHGPGGIAYCNPLGLRPTGNQAPVVDAGPDRTVTLPAAATLAGSASDDGRPNPPGALTLTWTRVSGPGTVAFANAAVATTTATFSEAGVYVLRLTAFDGALSVSNDMQVAVQEPAMSGWTAYNDCSWATGQLNTRITTCGLNQSGAMVDYATGSALPVRIQVVNHPTAPANAGGTGGPMPNSGTDAHDTFNGKVSFADVIWYGNSGWWVDAVFTGLDPSKEYEFATSVNRGNSSYTTRWSKFTISDIDSATPSSTAGVQVNSPTSVSFWCGYNNVNGHVARWTKIKSGADGSFRVRAEADGQSGHDVQKAYAFDGIMLRESAGAPTPLSATLSAPTAGATFAANAAVTVAAVPVGGTTPHTVQFHTNRFGGAFGPVGGPLGAAPYQANLGALPPGQYAAYAVVTDAASGEATTATNAFTVTTRLNPVTNTLITAGSAWKYLDNGSDQGTAWRAPAFDDSAWAQGAAPLGYGDSWIVTTVYSPPAPNRYITTYFRREFTTADPGACTALNLKVMRDDGVVVYLNGTEAFRGNMPEGPIDYLTFSSTIVGDADETAWFPAAIPVNLLVAGRNVLAIELHQRDGTSSDLTLDAQLAAVSPAGDMNQAPVVSAGADRIVVLPAAAVLGGSATDDGLPVPPAALTLSWSEVSGPGTVTFADAAAAATTATFSEPGEYVLRLTADDGARTTSADCTVTVHGLPSLAIAAPAPATVVVANDTATFTVAGTAANAVGDLTLANSLGGGITQVAGAAWSFADVPLTVGVNEITVAASNAAGLTASDRVTIIRQAAASAGLRIASFSDPHYFATNLLISNGPAFQMYLAQDRKLIAESVAITKSVVDQLIARNANYVLVTGDLTKDGELDSHIGFAAELGRLEAAGAQVLVVPGNHDINSPAAVAYDGTNTIPVPNVSPEQFRAIYAAYGYDLAAATDTASVAYSVALTPDILMLCMDSCRYGDTAGGFDTARLAWIEGRLAAARAEGKLALGMMHHGLMEHFQGQKAVFSEYVLDGYETVAPRFASYGMRAVFTGHFHANDIVAGTFGGRTIHDIETGSTVTWPCPYRVMELGADGNLAIATHAIEAIEYDLGGAPDFQTYAYSYLRDGMLGISSYMLQMPPYSLPVPTANYLAPAVTEALVLHYAGDEPGLSGASPATQAIVMGLLGSGDPLQIMLGQAIYAILLDLPTADNNLTLDLDWPPSAYWLDTEATVGGTVDPADGWVTAGAPVPLAASAQPGNVFVGWTGDVVSTNNPLMLTMDQPYAVTALFEIVPTLAIQVPADGATIPAEQASVAVTISAERIVGGYTYANATMGVTVPSAAMTVALPLQPGANTLTVSATGIGGILCSGTVTVTRASEPDRALTLGVAGSLSVPNAEIVAYDAASRRAFVTCQSQGVRILDLSAPFAPTLIGTVLAGETVNSVAVKNGRVAAAVENATPSDPGEVVFMDTTGAILRRVTVGIQPDMVAFTPDGNKALTANEAETADHADYGAGSVSIIDLSGGVPAATVTTLGFDAFDSQTNALRAAGVRIFAGKLPSVDFEPEYIAVSPDGTTALVTLQENNALAKVNLSTRTITEIVPLGLKDHSLPGNGLDASDQDGPSIHVTNWPVSGMYMPDAIASFSAGGQTYYVTANEGDVRDAAGEAARIGSSSIVLDPTAFPTAATLKLNANLGRLNASKLDGDLDGDGDLDRLQIYGGRSFSIRNAAGVLVFDSGDELEQITADLTPTLFNANDGIASKFDQRSDDKGAEPEGVEIGVIDGCTYAFVALERAGGGIMVYDVSRPEDPLFVQYIRRDGDVAPEGVKFVAAGDSPNGKALLLVANETSQTLTVYEIEPGAHLRVLTPDASVDPATASYRVEGRFQDIAGDIVWSNRTSGAGGVANKGAGTWSAVVPIVGFRNGVNDIVVRGAGPGGAVLSDTLTVRRDGPRLELRINGSPTPSPVRVGVDRVLVEASLDAASYAGSVSVDWWLLADTPAGWHYYDPLRRVWLPGLSACAQGMLADQPWTATFDGVLSAPGEYRVYAGVDAPMDGALNPDMLFYDSVSVTVTP